MATTAMLSLIVYAGLVAVMSAWADRRFRGHPRLPMQWGLNRLPNWYAPRRWALAVTPLLSGIGLIASALLILGLPGAESPSADQAGPLLFGLGGLGVAVYAVYLWLVRGWAQGGR